MIDQQLIGNFIWESTKETFETMIFLPVEKADEQSEATAAKSLICTITFTLTRQYFLLRGIYYVIGRKL